MMNENGPIAPETTEQVPSASSKSKQEEVGNEKENSIESSAEENRDTEKLQEDSNENDAAGDFVDFSEQSAHERKLFREFADMINQLRFNCGMLINNTNVQFVIILMISINAIMMGIGTYDFVKRDEHLNNVFETIDLVFLIIFTVELFLQFIYHGWRLLLDGWLVFDLAIILTSWSFSSVQIIRAFRIFRALRLVTRIKIMKDLILGTLIAPALFKEQLYCLRHAVSAHPLFFLLFPFL
jgi:hypothetical protein